LSNRVFDLVEFGSLTLHELSVVEVMVEPGEVVLLELGECQHLIFIAI
jgi:hypothetical protein